MQRHIEGDNENGKCLVGKGVLLWLKVRYRVMVAAWP